MSVITPPTLRVNSFKWTPLRNQIASSSVFGRQAIEASGAKWQVSMTGVPQIQREAIIVETFLESFNGLVNQVEMYHLAQPAPTGTMRGSMVLDADAAASALSIVIDAGAGQAGTTLLLGDLLGLGSGLTQHVVRVAADAQADSDGVITVTLSQPLRNAFLAGVEVRWDKPKALFRQKQNNSGVEYTPGRIGQPWALDLQEDWRP
jgi:hypothetical protein